MKKLSFVMLIALVLISCGKASKTRSNAEKAMIQLFKEVANVPESVKVDNVEVKYSNDSLCILNANFTAKNRLGHETTSKYEYIYLISKGKAYESFEEVGGENVFVSLDDFDRVKKGKIYETLPYDLAIRHLASVKTIVSGREVGDRERNEVYIPITLNTGLWEKRQFSDSFNEKTDKSFLLLIEEGAFSNSATSGSKMTALLYVTQQNISIRLVEYGSSLVKDDESYTLRVKDSDEIVHNFRLYNNYNGDMNFSSYSGEGEDAFRKILEKGGTVTCVIEEITRYGTPSKYYFKLHTDGYNEAINLI